MRLEKSDKSTCSYQVFGMVMPNRSFDLGSSRHAYNGMEKDPEIKGDGNSYTTYFRQYDPRLGRWTSIDPVVHPWMSPYTAMDNNPILHNDPRGDDVGYESKKEKRQVRRKAFFDKEFRATHKERKNSDKMYIYKEEKNHPSLEYAQEVQDSEDECNINVLYTNYGLRKPKGNPGPGPGPEPRRFPLPDIKIKWPKISWEYYGDTKTVEEKGVIRTPKQDDGSNPTQGPVIFKSPDNWVSNTPILLRAASHPDNFVIQDQNGNNIVPPMTIVESTLPYAGVWRTQGVPWVSVPTTATVTNWVVTVTTQKQYNRLDLQPDNQPSGPPKSEFYVRYTVYTRKKLKINW